MPPTSRRRQTSKTERRAALQAQLLGAVERLAAAGVGFTEMSVDRLASEVGTTRTTFYVYFEDKADLLFAWLEDTIAATDAAAEPWWGVRAAPTRGELQAIVARILEVRSAHAAVLDAIYDTALLDPAAHAVFQRLTDRHIDRLRDHLEAGQRGGWVNADVAPAETATWLTLLIHRGQPVGEGGAGRVAAYTEILWNALYRSAAQ